MSNPRPPRSPVDEDDEDDSDELALTDDSELVLWLLLDDDDCELLGDELCDSRMLDVDELGVLDDELCDSRTLDVDCELWDSWILDDWDDALEDELLLDSSAVTSRVHPSHQSIPRNDAISSFWV